MRMKVKRISLVACLFLFLFVVIGNALHLNSAGAFLAAVTGTPLLIYVFNQRTAEMRPIRRHTQMSEGSDGRNQEHGDSSASWEDQSVSRQ